MVAVIGDVHGCYSTFKSLHNQILKKYPGLDIYCVGDMVDRGNGSFEVLEFCIKKEIKFTPGNHDYMFCDYFKNPDSLMARSWIFNGHEATLRSYSDHLDSLQRHLEFIITRPIFYNLDDCFISHAGISDKYRSTLPKNFRDDPNILPKLIVAEKVNESGVLWAREKLLNIGKLQIVGHTRQQEVRIDSKANAAYIDTGAYSGYKLSSVIVNKNTIIEIISEKTHPVDIHRNEF